MNIPGTVAPGSFRNGNVIWGIIRGLMVAIIISLVLLMVCTLILHLTAVPEKVTPYLACGISILSILVGSRYAGKRIGFRGWLHGGAVGILYIVVLILASMLVGNGFTFGFNLGSKLFLGLVFGVAGGMWGVNS